MTKESARLDMEDVARLAGVSKSTVSRSLAGSKAISAKTRDHVIAIARQHGYILNEAARRFRSGRTHTVSVVVPMGHDPAQPLSDPFFAMMLGLLADALSAEGYDLLLTRVSALDEDWIKRVAPPRRADGVIVIGQSQEEEKLEEAAASSVPLVVWGSTTITQSKIYSCVGSDNVEGGRLATQHLLNTGRKRILFIGDRALPEVAERYRGYEAAIHASGLAVEDRLYVSSPFDSEGASAAVRSAITRNLEFDGIVAASDVIAITALGALRANGLDSPGDVAVVGFDDIELAAHIHPALTTIRQDFVAAAHLLVRRLIDQIDGGPPTRDVLSVELVRRESS